MVKPPLKVIETGGGETQTSRKIVGRAQSPVPEEDDIYDDSDVEEELVLDEDEEDVLDIDEPEEPEY